MPTTAHILNPLSWVRLIRNSGGYGVHSPFAYRFITEVLRQENAYYCYSRLTDVTLRTVFRIVTDLRPRRVEVCGGKDISDTVHLADSKIRTFRVQEPEVMIVHGDAVSTETVERRIADGCAVILIEPAGAREPDAGRHCMSFSNVFANGLAQSRPMAVYVPRPDFNRQHFDLLF